MNRQRPDFSDNKYSRFAKKAKIAEATSRSSVTSQPVSAGSSSRVLSKSSKASYTIAPSEEFQVFWGESVDENWFKSNKPLSSFWFVLGAFLIVDLYLCFNLLFSSGNLKQSIDLKTSTSTNIQTNTNAKTFEEELILVKDSSHKGSQKIKADFKTGKLKVK